MGYFMEVEDEVEFTDISEVFVEDLDEEVDEFKGDQFVVIFVDDGDEVETCVSFVDDFVLFVVNEIAHLRFTGDDQLVYLS
jgi:hypothetical protein